MTAFPISSYLVPAVAAGPPGFTRIEQRLVGGLPATVSLSAELSLIVTVPTGLARTWLEIDPTIVVTQSFDQTIALPDGQRALGAVDRTPAQIVLVRSETVVGSRPLIIGRLMRVGDSADGTLVELIVLAWEIRAGTMKGAGDYGSFISLVWRDALPGADEFARPAVDPNIISRLKDRSRGGSELGSARTRLPAGYGPPPTPPAEPAPPDADIVEIDAQYYEKVAELEYYTVYGVP